MSLVMYLVVTFVVGLGLGFALPLLAAPMSDGLAKIMLKSGIKAADAWVLVQRGNGYELEPAEYDAADSKAYMVGDDDEEEREYFDDEHGLMKTLWKTPFGLAYEGQSAISDITAATVGREYGDLATDGGPREEDEQFTLDELKDFAHVGTLEKSYGDVKHRVEYINPFASVPEGREIVDVRGVVNLLKNNGSPETPRKTAENAAQAERAFDGMRGLKQSASMIAAAMVGGLLVYLGMSSGGGGGGTSVGLMVNAVGLMGVF